MTFPIRRFLLKAQAKTKNRMELLPNGWACELLIYSQNHFSIDRTKLGNEEEEDSNTSSSMMLLFCERRFCLHWHQQDVSNFVTNKTNTRESERWEGRRADRDENPHKKHKMTTLTPASARRASRNANSEREMKFCVPLFRLIFRFSQAIWSHLGWIRRASFGWIQCLKKLVSFRAQRVGRLLFCCCCIRHNSMRSQNSEWRRKGRVNRSGRRKFVDVVPTSNLVHSNRCDRRCLSAKCISKRCKTNWEHCFI